MVFVDTYMESIKRTARAIAHEAVKQNHMLEYCDEGYTVVGYFDDYDNKFYDCEEMAKVAIEAFSLPFERKQDE